MVKTNGSWYHTVETITLGLIKSGASPGGTTESLPHCSPLGRCAQPPRESPVPTLSTIRIGLPTLSCSASCPRCPHHDCDCLPGPGLRGYADWDGGHYCCHMHGPVEHPGLVQQPCDRCIQLPRAMALLCPRELRLHRVSGLLHPARVAR